MITSNVKISLDSDTATQVALDTNFTYDVGFNLPMPKLSKLELLGINGDVDITNALSTQTFYGNRTVNISLVVKNSSVNGGLVCDNFVNTYDGQRVRLHINNLYFLRGRLTVIGDNRADALRQLSVTIDAEPLKYETSYTPSASGFDIFPDALGENLWTSDNIVVGYPDWSALTESGGTIDADAEEIDGSDFEVIGNVTGTNKLLRLYTANRVNCTVQVVETDGETERIVTEKGGSSIYFTNGKRLTVRVYRLDTSAAASFSYSIREITTNTVNNSGKSVPFELLRSFYPNVETKPSVYVNGTIFKPKQSDNWLEYAPAVLKSGENIVAAFVDSPIYDPALSGGEFKMRYRKGVL